MAAAPAGAIYASAAVQHAAGSGLSLGPAGRPAAQGQGSGAVEAYALEGVERARTAARHRRHTLPMVGREDQLALLERHLVEVADGRGQVWR